MTGSCFDDTRCAVSRWLARVLVGFQVLLGICGRRVPCRRPEKSDGFGIAGEFQGSPSFPVLQGLVRT
uniref:Putative secreted protein n=1 Tax=Ixodes ricinus TaxID=34613 RepID=A0A6B0TWG2_IXORI